jgi:stage II sporulation protein D
VRDPYDGGELHSWTLTLGFSAAAARLRGLVHGRFRGIEVLKRGFSPRILSAYVLGSRGRTLVSGGELAARLGLYDTWAYFSVRRGTAVSAEPDRSGSPAGANSPQPQPATSPASPPAGAQGGVPAAGAGEPPPAASASAGGTSAPA